MPPSWSPAVCRASAPAGRHHSYLCSTLGTEGLSVGPTVSPMFLFHSEIRFSCRLCLSSTHPGICELLIRGWVVLAAGQAGYSRLFSPQPHFPAPPWGSRGVPRPNEIYNPSAEFWLYLGVFSQMNVSGNSPKGGAPEDLNKMLETT